MSNQTNIQNQHYNIEGLAIINRLDFMAKIITFITGGQLTSGAVCTLHETSAWKDSPLGTRQCTRKAKKTLKQSLGLALN